MYGLVSRYGGSYGGRFVLLAWPRQTKIALSPKFGEWRHFFWKEDLPTIKGMVRSKIVKILIILIIFLSKKDFQKNIYCNKLSH